MMMQEQREQSVEGTGVSSGGGGAPSRSAKEGGFMGSLFKIAKVLSLLLVVFVAGFYVGLFSLMGRGGGLTKETYRSGDGEELVVVVPIEGVIGEGTTDFVRQAVRRMENDANVKAVVLRVNSPGGGVTASDEILNELKKLKKKGIPVIASYGGYAASGGYYVSSFADRIYAQQTTLTGSIGVILTALTMQDLLTDKLGVKPEILHSTAATDKDLGSPYRDWTEKDRAYWKQQLDAIQARFVDVVWSGRGAEGTKVFGSREEVVEVATGRAFGSKEAKDLKLIDEIGYLDDAIDFAIQQGNFKTERPPVVMLGPARRLWQELTGVSALAPWIGAGSRGMDAASWRDWLIEVSAPRMMYLMSR